MKYTESLVEEAALAWFDQTFYKVLNGFEIAPGEDLAERPSFEDPTLPIRVKEALTRLNPTIPSDALDDAFRKLVRGEAPSLVQNNRAFHRMLINGIDVEYQVDGSIVHNQVRIIDFENPSNNDWAVVNQFTVQDGKAVRRPDIVVFINGLPIAVIELKNPADENATIWTAYSQLQTYKDKDQISRLFNFNEILVVSDGHDTRVGSLTAAREWFLPWRTLSGIEPAADNILSLEVLIKGLFDKARLLKYLQKCVVFEEERSGSVAKKIAGYHQFNAVCVAEAETIRASTPDGDKRVGVVWHTQGSGKSLTMAMYAGAIVINPAMANPTIVVLTDRNDLDDQLFGTFSRCGDLLRQTPVQAQSRAHLRDLLSVAGGGVVFTTIQKFFPEEKGDSSPALSDRRNIVVIADEAHRSQYDFIDGYARHMRDALPNASFIGFTGTPIELSDKNTQAVFGDYISIYDIQRAVDDKATVPIYYEGRLAKLDLSADEKPKIDPEFEEITEGEEQEKQEKLKTKWAALEAVVGSEKRLRQVAKDIVDHFEARDEALGGKVMIVCMSRRICADLYSYIGELRPQWCSDDDAKGMLKVVMTGSASDPVDWQKHIRNKDGREEMGNRFRDPKDSFKIAIVRDMWLTGFDVPNLHTMYIDKPMRGHTLMQAIARVNRVFRDKPGGLVVDYIGFAYELKQALAVYADSGGKGKGTIDQNEAVAVMLEKYENCRDILHGFDWSDIFSDDSTKRITVLPNALQHVLAQADGKTRFIRAATELSQGFALSVPDERALALRDDVAFFQAIRALLLKGENRPPTQDELMEGAIKQLISKSVVSDGIMDIFKVAGLEKPDISILSDEFLEEIRGLEQKNLAAELLERLLKNQIKAFSRRNLVEGRSFAEMLEKTVIAYQNRTIEAAKVIEELIELAKHIREAQQRGEKLGLSDEELAFYDALAENESAVEVLGDKELKAIAQELVKTVRKNATIDWTVRESIRAKMRVMIKRILRQHGYPPDKQEAATATVIEQAQLFADDWAA